MAARPGGTVEVLLVVGEPATRLALIRRLGAGAYACFPLVPHGEVIGTLSFARSGDSSFDAGELTLLAAFADQLIGYLEYAGRGPLHLVGNSLGGSICVRVAALRPDLIRTLTLISRWPSPIQFQCSTRIEPTASARRGPTVSRRASGSIATT